MGTDTWQEPEKGSSDIDGRSSCSEAKVPCTKPAVVGAAAEGEGGGPEGEAENGRSARPTEYNGHPEKEFLLKWLSLCLLVAHSVLFGLCFRYARLVPGPPWLNVSVLINSELVKLALSIFLATRDSRAAGGSLVTVMRGLLWTDLRSTLVMGLPGVLYTAQNYLYMVAISNLSASLYNVCKQANLLTTAVLSVVILKKPLSMEKWLAVVVLLVGVALVNAKGDVTHKGTPTVGLAAVFAGTWLTGLSGVFTELMLKRGSQTIWERNIQLSVFGLVFSILGLLTEDSERLAKGFFQGYKPEVWVIVFLQSFGGIVTAAVLKYADNVIKCVVKALALIICIFCSRVFFGEGPELSSPLLLTGVIFVLQATVLYTFGKDVILEMVPCTSAYSRLQERRAKYAQPLADGNSATSEGSEMVVPKQ